MGAYRRPIRIALLVGLAVIGNGIARLGKSQTRPAGPAEDDGVRTAIAEARKYPNTVDYLAVRDRFVVNNGPLESEIWPQPTPQLIGKSEDWLNTGGRPLYVKKGAVILIDYFEYTCVNCLRTLPYLKEWQRRYAKDGLVIIGIHTPEFAFAKEHANVARAVKNLGITWPVLIDSQYNNWNAFHTNFWPRKYFVDDTGMIVADHAGEGGYDESEALIQKLLRQQNPQLQFPNIMAAVRDTDTPGAVCYPTTPELYAGERGNAHGQHGNIAVFAPGKTAMFTDAGDPHEDGKIYANGLWQTATESLRHDRPNGDGSDYIALRYHALECNAVLKPEKGLPVRVYITQDGKPIAAQDKTEDTHYDPDGRSYIEVTTPRMYRLTKNAQFGAHELRLIPMSAGFGLYSFTFSSCEVR